MIHSQCLQEMMELVTSYIALQFHQKFHIEYFQQNVYTTTSELFVFHAFLNTPENTPNTRKYFCSFTLGTFLCIRNS